MTKRQKYEVVDFVHGGWFISGGSLTEMYIKQKDEADLICEALNMMERLKLRRFKSRVDALNYDLEQLAAALAAGTEDNY